MKNERCDLKTAVAVNKGIAAALLRSQSAGIQIMRDGGVAPEIIERILKGTQQRRSSDWRRQSD